MLGRPDWFCQSSTLAYSQNSFFEKPMIKSLLVILSFLLALIGGTGVYKFSGLAMNLLHLVSLITFLWIQLQQYQHGVELTELDFKKSIVFLLYACFLLAYFLREIQVDTEYQFYAIEGVMRQYSDLIRGLIVFLIVSVTYGAVKNSKIFVILPLLCLTILLIGLFLETYHIIDFNSNIHEEDHWSVTAEDKLLARPGGFMNPNMTSALAMIWVFISLESKINSSILIKGLAVILALTVCLLTQSRGGLLFLTMYALYKSIVLRNINFLVSILFVALASITTAYYIEFDLAQELIDKLSSRTASNESNAQERLGLLVYGFNSFLDAPLFGNGILYVAKTEGHGNSAHNQILEILTNFGLIGFGMMFVLYLTFYHKNSFSYLSLCIFPTLFFSHNFFENSAFQVALAFAYAVNSKEEG